MTAFPDSATIAPPPCAGATTSIALPVPSEDGDIMASTVQLSPGASVRPAQPSVPIANSTAPVPVSAARASSGVRAVPMLMNDSVAGALAWPITTVPKS